MKIITAVATVGLMLLSPAVAHADTDDDFDAALRVKGIDVASNVVPSPSAFGKEICLYMQEGHTEIGAAHDLLTNGYAVDGFPAVTFTGDQAVWAVLQAHRYYCPDTPLTGGF